MRSRRDHAWVEQTAFLGLAILRVCGGSNLAHTHGFDFLRAQQPKLHALHGAQRRRRLAIHVAGCRAWWALVVGVVRRASSLCRRAHATKGI